MPGSGPPDPSPPPASAYPELRRFLRHRGAVTGSVLLLVLIAATYSLVNLAVDLSYALVNPRIRYDAR